MSNEEIQALADRLWEKWSLDYDGHVYLTKDLFTLAIQDIIPKEETVIGNIKTAFYKGFEKCKNDDANCFTAWREEAPELINTIIKNLNLNTTHSTP